MLPLAALALVVAVGLASVGRPWIGVAGYGAVLPFGSALVLPGPGPDQARTLSSALGLCLVVSLTVRLLRRGVPTGPPVPAVGALLLFAGVATATTAWSKDSSSSAHGLVLLLSLLLLLVLLSSLSLAPQDLRRVELVVALVGGLVGAYGVWLALHGSLPDVGEVSGRFATAGGTAEPDPNITAAALLLPLVLGASGAMRDGPAGRRVLLGLAGCCTAAGIVLTGSRGGVLAALVGGAVLLRRGRPRGRLVAGLVAAVVVLAVVVAPSGPVERLTAQSSTGRAQIWQVGLTQCRGHCLSGSGLGTFSQLYRETFLATPSLRGHGDREYQAHNLWLALSLETGLLGAGLLALAVVLLLLQVRRLPASLRGPPQAVLLALLVSNLLLNNLTFKYFWFALAYVVVVLRAAPQPAELEPRSAT